MIAYNKKYSHCKYSLEKLLNRQLKHSLEEREYDFQSYCIIFKLSSSQQKNCRVYRKWAKKQEMGNTQHLTHTEDYTVSPQY